jgi:Flp pilus assembly protein TadD
MAGRFADAVEWERRAVELRPHFGTAWRTLAAAAGKAGSLDTASQALSVARRLHPSLSSARPSAKYCCSVSSLRLANGRTAIVGAGSDNGSPVLSRPSRISTVPVKR